MKATEHKFSFGAHRFIIQTFESAVVILKQSTFKWKLGTQNSVSVVLFVSRYV